VGRYPLIANACVRACVRVRMPIINSLAGEALARAQPHRELPEGERRPRVQAAGAAAEPQPVRACVRACVRHDTRNQQISDDR
jgi:hypothetical protein